MHIDIDIIVFAVVAIALLWRLWSVLGTRHEDERQQPNPFIPRPPLEPMAASEPLVPRPLVALPLTSLAGGMQQVKTLDPLFDEKAFLKEAEGIFRTIVETFASGDLSSIADKVSPPLLAHFQSSIDARIASGHIAQSRILSIADVDALSARSEETKIFVTVRFVSVQENTLRDTSGRILGGEVGKSETATDVWTFVRDTAVVDSQWQLVETRA